MGRSKLGLLASGLIVMVLAGGFWLYRSFASNANRSLANRLLRVHAWLRDPAAHPDWSIAAGSRCSGAPFLIPTHGFAGFLWDDSFRLGHRHQGIDIFGVGDVNVTPVIAAYRGYLTRLPDWKSTVIIRIPTDPLQPGRQIWTYYTHMAGPGGESTVAAQFPPGTTEEYVEAGTMLGYQGNYSGTPGRPVVVHLHFSIVLDDGQGSFRNELEISNTLDPSPYLGLPLNANHNRGDIPVCLE